MNVGGLFDGCGLLAYGLCLAGLEHSWLCEVDPFRRELLGRRWPGVRIFDDVRAVGAATAERVDVIAGGFPCKGASTAGKREGFGHPETRLWREMGRAVGELRPRLVVVENVANILGLHRGEVWGTVLGDLAALGYDVQWDCIPAAAFGASHLRDRVIAVAEDPDQRPVESGRLRRGEREADQASAAEPHGARELGLSGMGREPLRWPNAGGGDQSTAANAASEHREAGTVPAGSLGRVARRGHAAIADAGGGRQSEHAQRDRERRPGIDRTQRQDLERRGVAVGWGEYGPAIRRWEAVHGPAPQPLLRRVDDGRARWVERSRLSALGDGVQVQLGLMVGEFLMSLERAA